MSYRVIIYEVKDGVGVVTLNRPEKLNAWTKEMAAELRSALSDANDDDNVGTLVVTGAGRAFCSGADVIQEFQRRAEAQDSGTLVDDQFAAPDSLKTLQELLLYGKPSIAAINGYAVGVGLTFPLNCDIRIASEEAKLNTMFLRVGLIPEFGSSYLLPRIIGLGRALELVYMPRMIDAREAYELGLVNRVVPAERLMPEAMALAKTIASGPRFALKKAKETIYQNLDAGYMEGAFRELKNFADCMATAEHREGIRAFLEKREPDFQRPEVRGQ